MEPAMVFTVVIGACVLVCGLLGALRSTPSPARSLTTRARPLIVTMLVAVSLVLVRPWWAGATVPPPSVRSFTSPTVSDIPSPPTWSDGASDGTGAYTVVPGDCLWRIARALLIGRGQEVDGHRVTELWTAIYERNRSVIGSNPNLILPGQVLDLPDGG